MCDRVPQCDNKSSSSELNSALNRQGDDILHLFHLKPHLNPHILSFQQLQFFFVFFFAFEVIKRSSNKKKGDLQFEGQGTFDASLCPAELIIWFYLIFSGAGGR